MMGTFAVLVVWSIPQGVAVLGGTILIFMEVATGLAFLFGILFTPRAWCTVCPMGFTTGNIRGLLNKQTEKGKKI
jgi:polyferredoxin